MAAISISILTDRQIAVVNYEPGTVSRRDLAHQRKQVGEALMQNKIQKVLVDTTKLDKMPSPSIMLLHNQSIATQESLLDTRFAVVCSKIGENEQLLETTGVNRGLKIKCFTSRDEALSWLG